MWAASAYCRTYYVALVTILRTQTQPYPNRNPSLPCLAQTLILDAKVCTNMQLLSLSRLSRLSHLSTQVRHLLRELHYSKIHWSLWYPTTSVVSSQITIYMVGWSEVTSLQNPRPALLCHELPSTCLYLPISLPIQLGSLWNFKLELLCYKPIIPTCLFAIWGDYPMS